MKTLICILMSFVLALLAQDDKKGIISDSLRAEIIANTSKYPATEITFDKIRISQAPKKYKQSKELYTALHGKDVWVHESELLLAHFITADQHLGIITYVNSAECDRHFDQYFLYIVDKNGMVSDPFMIKTKENGITLWEVQFKFISESVIQLLEKTTSEWAIEGDVPDTVFSGRYQINFTKTPFDTIKTTHSEKIIPPASPARKAK